MSEFVSTVARARSVGLLAVFGVLAIVVSGCASPGYSTEEEMLFEDRINIEPKGGVYLPSESAFSEGTAIGARLAFEYAYASYFAFEFTSTSDIDQDDPYNGLPIRGADETAIDSLDRRSYILSFDWDYLLSADQDSFWSNWRLRWGIGAGILEAQLSTNAAASAAGIDLKDQAMFILRPTLGLHFDVVEDLSIFVDGQYDWAESKIRDRGADDDKSNVVDFGGINLLVGVTYSF